MNPTALQAVLGESQAVVGEVRVVLAAARDDAAEVREGTRRSRSRRTPGLAASSPLRRALRRQETARKRVDKAVGDRGGEEGIPVL
jgi:hypothetical protein